MIDKIKNILLKENMRFQEGVSFHKKTKFISWWEIHKTTKASQGRASEVRRFSFYETSHIYYNGQRLLDEDTVKFSRIFKMAVSNILEGLDNEV